MNDILHSLAEHYLITAAGFFMMTFVIIALNRCICTALRMMSVRRHGWPPPHLDSNGLHPDETQSNLQSVQIETVMIRIEELESIIEGLRDDIGHFSEPSIRHAMIEGLRAIEGRLGAIENMTARGVGQILGTVRGMGGGSGAISGYPGTSHSAEAEIERRRTEEVFSLLSNLEQQQDRSALGLTEEQYQSRLPIIHGRSGDGNSGQAPADPISRALLGRPRLGVPIQVPHDPTITGAIQAIVQLDEAARRPNRNADGGALRPISISTTSTPNQISDALMAGDIDLGAEPQVATTEPDADPTSPILQPADLRHAGVLPDAVSIRTSGPDIIVPHDVFGGRDI